MNLHTVLKYPFIQSEKKYIFAKGQFFNIRIFNLQLLHIDWGEKCLDTNENIKVFLAAVSVIPGIESWLKTFVFKKLIQ